MAGPYPTRACRRCGAPRRKKRIFGLDPVSRDHVRSTSATGMILRRLALTRSGAGLVLLVAWEVTADHWPSDNTAYQPIVVESDLVSFDLTGAFPELPIVSLDTPRRIDAAEAQDETSRVKKAKDPTFVNMTADQSGAFLLAHRWAYKAINEALASAKVGSTWEYKRWMEDMFLGRAGREDRHRTVIANLSAMAEWMETASIDCELVADCQDKDWDAWTWVKQRSTISVCGRAMNDHWLRFWYLHSPDWGRALLLIHEIAHAVAGVGDHVPAWPTLCNHLLWHTPGWPWITRTTTRCLRWEPPPVRRRTVRRTNGIWTSHPVPGDWYISHAPAAALIAEDAVMTAYAEAPAHGGRLSYRMLHLEDGKENWKDASLIRAAGGKTILPSAAPRPVAVAQDQNLVRLTRGQGVLRLGGRLLHAVDGLRKPGERHA